jgi:hypothetical protein
MNRATLKHRIEQLLKLYSKERHKYMEAYKKVFGLPYSTKLGIENDSAELLRKLIDEGFLDKRNQNGNIDVADVFKGMSNPEEIVALLTRHNVEDLQDCRNRFLNQNA